MKESRSKAYLWDCTHAQLNITSAPLKPNSQREEKRMMGVSSVAVGCRQAHCSSAVRDLSVERIGARVEHLKI